jgi:lipopolysaccharide/colanic/teichoic acid biosynthesis glycosyltransferase
MTLLQFASQSAEEWISSFDPQERSLGGDLYLSLKRLMDLTLVVMSMPLWLPMIVLIGLVIKITSPGAPVIFRQLRTGQGGRRFGMYKFRTMVPNAEELKGKICAPQ